MNPTTLRRAVLTAPFASQELLDAVEALTFDVGLSDEQIAGLIRQRNCDETRERINYKPEPTEIQSQSPRPYQRMADESVARARRCIIAQLERQDVQIPFARKPLLAGVRESIGVRERA